MDFSKIHDMCKQNKGLSCASLNDDEDLSRAMEGVLDQGPDDDAVDVPIVPMTRRKMTSIWSPWRARPTIVGGAEQVVEAVMGGAVWVVEVMMGSTMAQCRAVEAT
jgi:hypothetical protein